MALLRNSTPSCERRRLRASGLAIAGKAETLPPRARRNRWGSVKAMTSDGPARLGRHDRMSRRSPWIEADQEVRPRGDLACRTSAFSTPRDLGGHESIVLSADIECSDEESVQEARGRIAEDEAVQAATCALLYPNKVVAASVVRGCSSRKEPFLEGCCYRASNGCWTSKKREKVGLRLPPGLRLPRWSRRMTAGFPLDLTRLAVRQAALWHEVSADVAEE
ncbi:unnamed protein product [Symbiodinium sp. KB8]|nr:unnamed protein product [Symbiodinium sp. KB8]